MNLNRVFLAGNLTRDPETRYAQSGTAVVKFAIATNRRYKKGDEWVQEPTYVDVTMFGKRGEAFAKYHSKGKAAFVEGELRLDQWEDKDTGRKRSKLYVVANNWEFVGGKRDDGDRDYSDDYAPADGAGGGFAGGRPGGAVDDDTPF